MADEHLGFYLTNDANQTIELPLNPADIVVKVETDDKSETIVKLGEINIVGERKLTALSIESSIPVDTEIEHYLSAEKPLEKGQDYLDWIESVFKSKKPLRLVVSTTKISLEATVASFEYGLKDGNDAEYKYTLSLKEYREFRVKKTGTTKENNVTPNDAPTRSSPPDKVGMGSKVIVNGQLHRDSQGSGPGQTEQNATRKISLVAPGSAYPYHVTTLDGGARGWVKESEVKAL